MEDNRISQSGELVGTPLESTTTPPVRILMVEDDAAVRQLNVEVLTRFGYEVEAAADGAAGWDALQANYFDLMITDNSMPKMTGVELLKKLRYARMELPVIMARGALPTQAMARSPWLEPAVTLLKPYSLQELLDAVKNVLREAESAGTGIEIKIPAATQTAHQPEPPASRESLDGSVGLENLPSS